MHKRFTFFWDGPFSQWHPAYFEVGGVEFNCAEQFMMAQKARLFGDEDAYERIMESEVPAVQKRLGRLVEGFDRDVWEEEEDNGRPWCWNMVWRGNQAKFTQNQYLMDELLSTAGTTLVEASPEDTIWGIGLAEDHPGALDRSGWRGLNWLGEVLTDLREHLIRGES